MLNYSLMTSYGEKIDKNDILPEYPRPQLKRESYLNLNGEWDFTINKSGEIPNNFLGKILVPFPVESYLSGIRKEVEESDYLIYKRTFNIKRKFIEDITLLHIDAADEECTVYINGKISGTHEGGYLPGEFDISDNIKDGENTIIIIVKDEGGYKYPSGKQRKKRGGIWYTPISGIWQSVWIESVSKNYIKNLKITPDIDKSIVLIETDTKSEKLLITIKENRKVIYKEKVFEKTIEIPMNNPKLWSPENPFLYDIEIESDGDKVESYFAMRKFSVDGKKFLLNNKPYFILGVLDQGYFSDGIYTPANYEEYRQDIIKMKELGFNTLRKHIKIEPMMFYYYCDTIGMLVFQDMVNVGKYSFFKDSIIPFAGFRNKLPWKNVDIKQQELFKEHSIQTVNYLYNTPSIVYYTIFNEGWGQWSGDEMYDVLRAIDSTRVYDSTSGWFKETKSDVDSKHIYFKPIKIKESDKTIIVSEFGGYSYKILEHSFNDEKTFGYRKFEKQEEFEEAFIKLFENEILNNIANGLAGAIYTQVSDVEDETNGILTYDRKVNKLNKEKILPIMEKIKSEYEKE